MTLAGAESTLVRVTEVQREGVTLHDADAEHGARLLPALRHALAAQGDAIAVGDWVLARANASDMGLSAYAFTQSPKRARRAVAELKAGVARAQSDVDGIKRELARLAPPPAAAR